MARAIPTRCCSPVESFERPALLFAEESHLVERGAHPLVDLAPRHTRNDQRQRDILGNGTIVQELVILETTPMSWRKRGMPPALTAACSVD